MLDRTQGKRKLTKLASLLLLLTPIQTTWDSTDMARNVDLSTGGIDLSPAGHPLSILSTCFILITRFSRVPGRFIPAINNNYNACFYGRQTSSNFKFRQGSLFRSPNHAELVSTSVRICLTIQDISSLFRSTFWTRSQPFPRSQQLDSFSSILVRVGVFPSIPTHVVTDSSSISTRPCCFFAYVRAKMDCCWTAC